MEVEEEEEGGKRRRRRRRRRRRESRRRRRRNKRKRMSMKRQSRRRKRRRRGRESGGLCLLPNLPNCVWDRGEYGADRPQRSGDYRVHAQETRLSARPEPTLPGPWSPWSSHSLY